MTNSVGKFFKDCVEHIIVVLTHGDAVETTEEEQRLTQECKDSLLKTLGVAPKHILMIANHSRNLTPSGIGRAESAIKLLQAMEDILKNKGAAKFLPTPVNEKEVEKHIQQEIKKRCLHSEDYARIFADVLKIIPIFVGAGGGCVLI